MKATRKVPGIKNLSYYESKFHTFKPGVAVMLITPALGRSGQDDQGQRLHCSTAMTQK